MCRIIGKALPDMPWQERPEGDKSVVWRYSQNPIITKKNLPEANSIFNSAVVPFKNGYIGVFRVDNLALKQCLHVGKSADGIHWELEEEPIKFISEDPETGVFVRGFDPRVCFIEDRYYIVWCNIIEGEGSTVGMAYTFDFKEFHQLPNVFPLYNRNGVLFPEKINGKYALLNRPSLRGHCSSGSIFYSESPDLVYWGRHRLVMQPATGWQETKIGAGPIPIKTDEGWLVFYHGVVSMATGYKYSMGAALLDLEEPWKVLYRSEAYLLAAEEDYERYGDCTNVIFPCAALADSETGRIAVYYGAADTVVGLAFCKADEVIDFIKKHNIKGVSI